ncbi:MAG: DNA-3-methyladenine glycosylase family protein [Cytophagales bacterium]
MNSFKKAFKHLEKDEIMKFLIKNFGDKIDITDRYNENYARAISDLIIEQQISFKVAKTIKKKFKILIQDLTDSQIINLENSKIKSLGLSGRKVDYIKNVYTFFREQKINFETLKNDEIIKILCKIKGVGSWTAEMFLIFILFRKNIFSIKDIALINSIKKNYKIMNLDSQKLNELIRSWEPYNTAASLLLWKSIEEKTFYK